MIPATISPLNWNYNDPPSAPDSVQSGDSEAHEPYSGFHTALLVQAFNKLHF